MRRSLRHIWLLGIKELRSLRADPVLVFLILYSFTIAIYSVATGAKLEVSDAAVGWLDEDRTDLSRRLRAAIQPPLFKPPVDVAAQDIDRAMDKGDFVFVVEIPLSLEADLLAGRKPEIQINIDATAMAQAGNGAVYLQSIFARELSAFLEGREGLNPAAIDLVVRAKFNPNLKSEWFTSVMQVINNITMLAVILTGAALIREREQGTIEHLLVMPVTPTEIMLSKIWANGLVIILAALLSLVAVVQGLLQVPIAGSLALFGVGATLYLFSVTALGVLLATIARSMAQFGLLVIPVLIAMNLLSGSTTAMESMPVWLQNGVQISPATHFVKFSQAILYRGAGFAIVWPQLLILAAIGAGFFALSLVRFRKAISAFQ
jgi:ABC-2 type transport system permease protein